MTSVGRGGPNLDRDYDLRAAFPDYVTYFEDWRSRSEKARAELPCLLDVAYGSGGRDHIDFFSAVPAAGSSRPLLVFIHGGYWRSMDKSDFSFLAVPFVKRGASLALVNYELFPGTTMSKVVAQVHRACTWINDNASRLGISFDELHLAGWSAGAHLCAMVACSTVLPVSSLTAVSGIYDLRPILQTTVNADLHLDEAEASRNSPVNYLPPRLYPIALSWGGNETGAFRRQSSLLATTWREKGANIYELELTGLHHYAAMGALADEHSTLFSLAFEQILGVRRL